MLALSQRNERDNFRDYNLRKLNTRTGRNSADDYNSPIEKGFKYMVLVWALRTDLELYKFHVNRCLYICI